MRRVFLVMASANFAVVSMMIAWGFIHTLIPNFIDIDQASDLVGLVLVGTWGLAGATGVLYGLMAAEPARIGNRSMACRGCGYLLEGLQDGRCPECGREFDPSDPRSFAWRMEKQVTRWAVPLAATWVVFGPPLACCGMGTLFRWLSMR